MGSQFSAKLLPAKVKPLSASLKLTENCRAKCVTCNYWQTRWEDSWDTGKAVDIVNRLGKFGIRYLRFTGGEPLLRSDLFRITREANMGQFTRVTLHTNGLLLKKLHKEINAPSISKVLVSIDGLEASNDLIRGIKGYFRLAIEGISLLKGKQVAVVATLNGRSAGELEDLADTAKRAGAGFSFNILDDRLYFLRHTSTSDLWPNKVEIAKIMAFLGNRLKRPTYELEYIYKSLSRYPRVPGTFRCIKRGCACRLLCSQATRECAASGYRGTGWFGALSRRLPGNGPKGMSRLHLRYQRVIGI